MLGNWWKDASETMSRFFITDLTTVGIIKKACVFYKIHAFFYLCIKQYTCIYNLLMKEFVISEAQTERAVLVGLVTQTQNERKTNEYLDELAFLAETAGAEVVKRFTQKLDTPNSVTYVGKGKLQEIKEYLSVQNESEETEIGMVIFDDELSAKQIRNIENELKVKILDRTSLILDIFAMRAQTANAKTQVELAQYKYMLPPFAAVVDSLGTSGRWFRCRRW